MQSTRALLYTYYHLWPLCLYHVYPHHTKHTRSVIHVMSSMTSLSLSWLSTSCKAHALCYTRIFIYDLSVFIMSIHIMQSTRTVLYTYFHLWPLCLYHVYPHHAKHTHCVIHVMSSMTSLSLSCLSTSSHKRHEFWGKKLLKTKCVSFLYK